MALAPFFGRYEHSIDDKGRVILPAKFRSSFEHGGYLTQYLDGCLALWTSDQFESQSTTMQERASQGRAQRLQARYWSASSVPLDMDRQGRMAIPAHLRAFAALESDVLVLGAIDRVELWNSQRWEETVGPAEQQLTEGVDG